MPEMDETLFALSMRMRMAPEHAAGVACVVAETAKALWDGGVMLNDIKASNIMFKTPAAGETLFPRLVDYGCFVDKASGDAFSCTYPPPDLPRDGCAMLGRDRAQEPGDSAARVVPLRSVGDLHDDRQRERLVGLPPCAPPPRRA